MNSIRVPPNEGAAFRIVAAGIVNAGKSSVLSALADRRGLFPDSELPGLTRSVQREIVGVFQFIDTPGLDGNSNENRLTLGEVENSDAVLWCHSIRMGELRPTEITVLGRVIGKTCFVLTHEDDVAGNHTICEVSQTVARQLESISSYSFFAEGENKPRRGDRQLRLINIVGIRSYWQALDFQGEKREKFLRHSGVPKLRKHLEDLFHGFLQRSEA